MRVIRILFRETPLHPHSIRCERCGLTTRLVKVDLGWEDGDDEGECDGSSSDEGESDAVIGVMREKVMTVMEGSLR
jgi:hypothetical protein